eukprot:m.66449 g.66449  ORF g.66449 m.66449 type:complete len:210 (-) comp7624_c0_seq2:23-652(-)
MHMVCVCVCVRARMCLCMERMRSRSLSLSVPSDDPAEKFGLMGLLSVIRMTEQDLNTLALGSDLTELGLNLNSPDPLYPTFASPWSDTPLHVREPQFSLPACYSVKMPQAQRIIPQFSEETLFYIFYSMPQDQMQQAAAIMLYQHDWRYHKEHKFWITRIPGSPPTLKTATFERGTYSVFDVASWKKVSREMDLYYDALETRTKPVAPQ